MYICQSSFKNHVLNHKVQDAASKYPNKEVIMAAVDEIGGSSLEAVAKLINVGDSGGKFEAFVKEVASGAQSDGWRSFLLKLGDMMLDSAVGVKFFLPSKLVSCLIDRAQVPVLSSHPSNYSMFLNLLNLPSHYSFNLQSQCFLEFVMAFVLEIVSFISFQICSGTSENTECDKLNDDLTQDEREDVYYIGGSIMRGYLRLARRFSNSSKWLAILDSLRKNVLTDQPVGDSNWTSSVDRGGLLYINTVCQNFFTHLTKIVFSLENRDGSIDFDEVISAACNSSLPGFWDVMFSGISEGVLLNFMNDVIKSFCKTCGRGFAKRRLNNLRRDPVVSMPTRHLVASRKSK